VLKRSHGEKAGKKGITPISQRNGGYPLFHTWLECGTTPYTEGTPFHPIIALVAQGLAFTAEDTAAEKLGKLEVGLGALSSQLAITSGHRSATDGLGGRSQRPTGADPPNGRGAQPSAETVALLADFLGVPPPMRLQLSPELQRRKTIDLLVQWTLSLSAAQPLVLFIEDLHWCDVSTLELLGHLIAQSPTVRVLLLATARPDFTPPWPARSNLTTVQLARLTKRQARDMVERLAGKGRQARTPAPPEQEGRSEEGKSNGVAQASLPADLISDEVLEQIVKRADGMPLYLEELTKTLLEPGAAWNVEAIPASLADSLMGRLDRLSTAKEVAQRAAALGREFGYPLLAATVSTVDCELPDRLTRGGPV
jgi:hypothetical protein